MKFSDRLRPRIFYGWWIALIGMVMNAPASGSHWTGATVFFLPITLNLRLDWVRDYQVNGDGATGAYKAAVR